VLLMKSIKLILLATAMLAVASLAVGTTIQAQAKSTVFNGHSHSTINSGNGELTSNDGSVLNTDGYHSNRNDNTNRPYDGECCEDRVRDNTHPIPNNGK
jgi:hypothetical protein